MIYLQPHSGLANRLRVIVSGLHFANVINNDLVIIWRKDTTLYCDFAELFENDEKIILKNYYWRFKFLTLAKKFTYLFKLIAKILSIHFTFFDNDVRKYVWDTGSNNIDFAKLPKNAKNYYFFTCHEFYFDNSYLNHLRPIESLQKKINLNTAKFNSKTIGIHIRRSDHLESISKSPLESFIEVIKNDLSQNDEVNYFLATDDKEVEKVITKLFPSKIFTYEKDYSRNSVKGIQDALVDLYSLAGTTKIYGSYFSSFSDMASRIGNIPLEIVCK